MSEDPILSHCEMLHSLAKGIDGVLVVSVFYANPHGEDDRPGAVTHHPVGDPERMADAIKAHLETPNANVYCGLQVMRRNLARGSRGTERDIVAVLGLVADMDADTGKSGADMPFPPSYSVETSPGNEQPFWLFERPLTVAEAKPLARSLKNATGGDHGTADVSHVFRVPGTLNWPNKAKIARGRSPEPVDVLVKQPWDGAVVSIADFAAALAPFAGNAPTASAVSAGEIPDHVDTSTDIAEMLAADGQPDRSAHVAKLVERIAFAGHTLEEAVALMLSATGAWTERYRGDTARQQADIERLWSKFGGKRAEDMAAGREIAESWLAGHAPTREPISPPPELDAPLIKATPFEWIDPTTLPRREFLSGTHLIRKYVSVTVAPGGIGKSSLTIAEALAMATGRPLLGGRLEPRRKVWLYNGEDGRDELNLRLMAACLRYNIQPEDIAGQLFLDSGREAQIVVAIDERNGVKIIRPVVDAVVAAVKQNDIDVMIIDPFVSTHGVQENDNGAIDKVAKLWAKIADECNIAVEVVHHVRKVDGREVTVDDARGAVALLAASRSARVLNRMSADEAKAAGVSEDDRFQYFSVVEGKANLAPLSSRAVWRKLESVQLENHGVTLDEPGDHAGVVVEWQWPSNESATEEVSADQLRLVQIRVAAGDYRKDPQAKDWVGNAVAEVLDMDAKGDKALIKRMVAAWIAAGRLVVVNRKDKAGKMVPFVDVGEDAQ